MRSDFKLCTYVCIPGGDIVWTGRIYRMLGKLTFRVGDCSHAPKLQTERLPLKTENTEVTFQKAVFFIASGIRISNFTTQKLNTEFWRCQSSNRRFYCKLKTIFVVRTLFWEGSRSQLLTSGCIPRSGASSCFIGAKSQPCFALESYMFRNWAAPHQPTLLIHFNLYARQIHVLGRQRRGTA